MLVGQATASADFSGDFAPSNWTYSQNATGPTATLTSSQMQLTSANDAGTSNVIATYSVNIPNYWNTISFNYAYVTRDVSNSTFDMPSYSINGRATNLVASTILQNGTETGTVTLNVASLDNQSFAINQACNDCILGSATTTITGFTAVRKISSNTLRRDTSGTTTEKNNVVSCTPGKYTLLNGGTNPEAAKVESFIYTLLVNGKAVSTLSSDGFKSVPSHLFPTIAGNMAGTATLEGATWDLKGMSNYSAQCQVHAYQSGANTQSVTTAASDSVALAAAAEAAAKAQATKDMIANWNSSNEELAKKFRDNRLAGKP